MRSQLPEVSALLDGELEPHEFSPTLDRLACDEELRASWGCYVLIGHQLRQDYRETSDMSANVMAKIREEPVVLAPRNLQMARSHHPLLALAASVAGVAVVGWLALSGNIGSGKPDSRIAAVLPAPTVEPLAASQPQKGEQAVSITPSSGDLSEYLLAHHTQASAFRFGDNAGHIRTVSLPGRSARP